MLVSYSKGTLSVTHLIGPVGLDDNAATVKSRFQNIRMTSGPDGGVVDYFHHVTFEQSAIGWEQLLRWFRHTLAGQIVVHYHNW